jgi:hypothetical protein
VRRSPLGVLHRDRDVRERPDVHHVLARRRPGRFPGGSCRVASNHGDVSPHPLIRAITSPSTTPTRLYTPTETATISTAPDQSKLKLEAL